MNIVISLFNLSGMDDVSWLHRNDDGSTLNTSDGWQELGNLPSGTAVAAEKKNTSKQWKNSDNLSCYIFLPVFEELFNV